MNDLETAREELEKAIVHLEEVTAKRSKIGDAALEQALKRAHAENRRLQKTTDLVSNRIDDAIGRLKATLAGDSGRP